ncbi:MAG: hypothetical protein EBS86_10925 [Crocinitomicaceae bacterium]|nr:hypothetical protein [Crocinitomicaceae bacterium]
MWIDLAVNGWYTPTQATSDYFNICNEQMFPCCNWAYGCQDAFEGNAFCGIVSQDITYDNQGRRAIWSEYISTKLIKPLKNNALYQFKMKINRADGYNASVKNIGAHFSNYDLADFSTFKAFNFIPTIKNNGGYIDDTLNWKNIESEFIATGDENYLTIGWFGDTLSDDFFTHFVNSPYFDSISGELFFVPTTYYLIDFIELFELTYSIDQFNVNVFSPNDDSTNDNFDLSVYNLKELDFEVLNRWGNVVFESQNPQLKWDGKDNQGNKLKDGVYFYTLNAIQSNGKHIFKSNFLNVFY